MLFRSTPRRLSWSPPVLVVGCELGGMPSLRLRLGRRSCCTLRARKTRGTRLWLERNVVSPRGIGFTEQTDQLRCVKPKRQITSRVSGCSQLTCLLGRRYRRGRGVSHLWTRRKRSAWRWEWKSRWVRWLVENPIGSTLLTYHGRHEL